MFYRIAGVDVHKKMLAVVVSAVEVDGQYQFERRTFGSNPEQLRSLAAWLVEQEVEEERLAEVPWEWIQRNRSLLKSVPRQQPFLRRGSSPRGWVSAPVTTRVQA